MQFSAHYLDSKAKHFKDPKGNDFSGLKYERKLSTEAWHGQFVLCKHPFNCIDMKPPQKFWSDRTDPMTSLKGMVYEARSGIWEGEMGGN